MRGKCLLSVLAIVSAFSVAWMPIASAHSDPATYDLKIESQPLGSALQEFAKQSGIQVIFFSKVTDGHAAPELKGRFTTEAALARLLDDSKLTFREINPKTIEVRPLAAVNNLEATGAGTSSTHFTADQDRTGAILLAQSGSNPLPPGTAQDSPVVITKDKGSSNSQESSKTPGQLEEVVVTAQKRSESLRDVPISVIALSSTALESINVRNFLDLGFAVPDLRLSQFPFGSLQTRLFIRGIGNNDVQVTEDPAVGVYEDGVYIARSTGLAFELGDVERVEVLRGPQGTLYGRNTIGGAINIVNKRPTGELGFTGSASVGNLDYLRFMGKVDLPAVSGLATSVTGFYTQRGGLVENTGVGHDFGQYQRTGVRFAANWKASDSFSAYFTYEHTDDWNTLYYYQAQTVEPGYEAFVSGSEDRITRASLAEPVKPSTLKLDGSALTLEWNAGEATLRSITGYRDFHANMYMDFSANPNLTFFRVNPQDTRHHQFSEELQFLGAAFDKRLEYIVGAYYFNEGAQQIDDYDAGAFFITHRVVHASNESEALFANLTYKFTSRWALTVGGRYSKDKRDAEKYSADYTVPDPVTGVPPFTFDGVGSHSYSKFNPSANVSFKVNEKVNTYVKVVTGYRSGGFGTGSASKADFERGFKPEELVSYELGLKLEGLDNRLQFNTAIFTTKYKDTLIDIAVLGAPQYVASFNAGKATVSGAELDLTVLPYESLRLDVNYAYLHAKYDEVIDPQTGTNITDRYALPDAPKNSFNVTAQQRLAEISAGHFDLSLNYSWQDAVVTTAPVADHPGARIPAYGLMNARLSFETAGSRGHYIFSLWARNLLDEDYLIDSVGSFPFTTSLAGHGAPRTYGLDVEAKF
jgi:iron complex outermembrane receptor protein